MTEDFLAGWKLARQQYQITGGVMPYPPGYKPEEKTELAPFVPPTKRPAPFVPPTKRPAKKTKNA